MGALIGLLLGVGCLLLWSAFTVPPGSLRSEGWTAQGRLRSLMQRAGAAEADPRGILGLATALGLVTAVLIQAVSAAWPLSVAFGTMAASVPFQLLAARARRRQREFAAVWPEAVDNLASAVRAGLSLPDGLGALAQSGPPVLRDAFAQFSLDYQVSGRFDDSLDRLKDRLADPVADRMVEGLRIAREVGGGDLGRLLRNLSGYLRDEARTRAELEARQAWTVNGARLAVAAPWVVLLMMAFQTDLIARYGTPVGAVVVGIGAAACAGAYWLMTRIGRLPVEQRILT